LNQEWAAIKATNRTQYILEMVEIVKVLILQRFLNKIRILPWIIVDKIPYFPKDRTQTNMVILEEGERLRDQ